MVPFHRYNLLQQYPKKPASPITLQTGSRWGTYELLFVIELLKIKRYVSTNISQLFCNANIENIVAI